VIVGVYLTLHVRTAKSGAADASDGLPVR
jgi:hypothetical protein